MRNYLTAENAPEFVGQIVDIFENYLSNEDDEEVAISEKRYDAIASVIKSEIHEYILTVNVITDEYTLADIVENIIDVFVNETDTLLSPIDAMVLMLKIRKVFTSWGVYQH